MDDIKYLELKIETDMSRLEHLKNREETDKQAREAFEIFDSLRKAGFSEDQAWVLFLSLFKAALC